MQVSSVSMENPAEVFEDGENPPSSRSSESGFTEFIQYQADRPDDLDRELNGQGAATIPIGSTSSETETASTVGSEETVIQPPSTFTQGAAGRSGRRYRRLQCSAAWSMSSSFFPGSSTSTSSTVTPFLKLWLQIIRETSVEYKGRLQNGTGIPKGMQKKETYILQKHQKNTFLPSLLPVSSS